MAYQSQSNAIVAFKPQVSKGTTVSGGSGFVLRTAGGPGGKITKGIYDSNEVTQDLMHSRGRHGLRKASGSYTCELSLDNCDSFYEAFFRGTWATALVETEATSAAAQLRSPPRRQPSSATPARSSRSGSASVMWSC
jgi:hypothetical protein